ncbi:MAG TPA: TetR family transcriptional regulator [Candidatus Eisenbergiella merdipullorum]|uniref:TetR family transcriptional regulator n=1 Tax=Candidatus Eisenbergiella merdipullorum TaxID=2838553 RepID=A0A9D2I8I6_9FIRM|nr:TetR family transcriptional regulator [Candidatus Eisenbergiella merdipullorum]
MPKGSPELTQARKDEIINACAELYETMNFKDVTLKEVGKKISFSRTLIYYYFHTKEEIFLALLQKEYEAWIVDLDSIRKSHQKMSVEQFSDELAHSLERRDRLLKLMSMNHYDMESNSRMENLIAFKTVYGNSMRSVASCLEKFFPRMTESDRQGFIYAFFPFLFGVYPYTVVTDKQKEAMEQAHANYVFLSVYEMIRSFTQRLLQSYRENTEDQKKYRP